MPSDLLGREQVLRTLADHLDDALLVRLFPACPPSEIRRILSGAPPPHPGAHIPASPASPQRKAVTGPCALFTDGASRGNPGRAGAGAVLFDDRGAELAAWSASLGTCTNNVAEYRALLLGLEQALAFGCLELEIALDSELIVRQIEGRYKVKNAALLPLFTRVRHLLSRFRRWTIRHVPREHNARADQLANTGIDQTVARE